MFFLILFNFVNGGQPIEQLLTNEGGKFEINSDYPDIKGSNLVFENIHNFDDERTGIIYISSITKFEYFQLTIDTCTFSKNTIPGIFIEELNKFSPITLKKVCFSECNSFYPTVYINGVIKCEQCNIVSCKAENPNKIGSESDPTLFLCYRNENIPDSKPTGESNVKNINCSLNEIKVGLKFSGFENPDFSFSHSLLEQNTVQYQLLFINSNNFKTSNINFNSNKITDQQKGFLIISGKTTTKKDVISYQILVGLQKYFGLKKKKTMDHIL